MRRVGHKEMNSLYKHANLQELRRKVAYNRHIYARSLQKYATQYLSRYFRKNPLEGGSEQLAKS